MPFWDLAIESMEGVGLFFTFLPTYQGHLEHLECSHQPHAQDRGAKKRPS